MPGSYFQNYEGKKVLPLVRKEETKRTTLVLIFLTVIQYNMYMYGI